MAAGPWEVLEKDLGWPEATDELPGRAGNAQRRPRKDEKKDADTPVSSDGDSGRAHGLEEARTWVGISEQDLDQLELSMPEPVPLGVDKKAAEKKRAEKGGGKGSTPSPPVPKSLPVQKKVEPSPDPTEEPLLWEGLTLNKCILVASIVALLSVTFQVLQAPCSREGISRGRQDPPLPPPLPEVVITKEEEVPEVVTAPPAQPESRMFQDSAGDKDGDDNGDDDDDDDSDADSNLAEPWIFKKWFGRSTPEDRDEEPVDVPAAEVAAEVPPPAAEVKKSREKKPEKEEEKEEEEEEEEEKEKKEKKPERKPEKKPEKKEEKVREGRATQVERSSRREARARDRGDKPSRAPRAPREPEQQPQKKRNRERKESRRERAEPRKEGWKGRPGRADGGGDSPKRDWRQQKGRKPWEPAAAPGKDGSGRPRDGKRRD